MKELARQITDEGYKLFDKLDIKQNETDKQMVVIVAHKILNDVDACNVLLDIGYMDQAYVILRTLLDKLFVMKAIMLDSSNVELYFKSQNHERNRKIKNAAQLGLIASDEAESLKTKNAKNVNIAKWAELAGMNDEYRREYAIFSDKVHVSEKSINDCLIYENGKLVAIDMKPNSDEMKSLISTAAHYALYVIELLSDYFKVECEAFAELKVYGMKSQETIIL